ncbi:nuclease-related domain-containing protein [Virgibacillus profundi]|nr:nuclease-related domain-containing protein [Virgibacillus profundi]
MILRKLKKSLVLQKYDAIIPRLRLNFPHLQEIEREQALRLKGYKGEKAVEYHLDFLAVDATILHDVCLTVMGKQFQIDNIVVTSHGIFPVESKNYSGTITFDTVLKQLIRENGMKETGYDYPVTQAELQKFKLQMWLQERNLQNIQIHPLVAISDPGTIIKVKGEKCEIAKAVAHGAHIPGMVIQKNNDYKEKHAKISAEKIGRAILKECKEFDMDVMANHGIKATDILPGVQCPACGRLGMKRGYGKWACERCFTLSKNAHLKAIADYLLLIKPWINNKEAMRFLNINCKSLANRILKSSGLSYEKEFKRWAKK